MDLEATPAGWDEIADSFDRQADHGLTDPAVRAAWRTLLEDLLPAGLVSIADLGCGTGSVTVLLAEMGHSVTGLDFSPAMVDVARAKAALHGLAIPFAVGDVADPPLSSRSVDVVLVRHVMWALPAPEMAIVRWLDALRPGGRIILIEGFWATGSGLHSDELLGYVTPHVGSADIRQLSDAALWGQAITDERYAIVAQA